MTEGDSKVVKVVRLDNHGLRTEARDKDAIDDLLVQPDLIDAD
jgi:hypothetical protein